MFHRTAIYVYHNSQIIQFCCKFTIRLISQAISRKHDIVSQLRLSMLKLQLQMVLPTCVTTVKVFDSASFAEIYRFPQDSVKLEKLLDQFRRYTNRRHADEEKWSPELRAYVVAQAVGPMGIDNEALTTFHFHERRFSNATPAQPMPSFPPFKAESARYCAHCQSMVHDGKGCIVRLLHVSMQIGLKLVNRCGFTPDWTTAFAGTLRHVLMLVRCWHSVRRHSVRLTARECRIQCYFAAVPVVWEYIISQITLQRIVTTRR